MQSDDASRSRPSPRRTILVVDDDGMMRALIGRILREKGYDVLLASSAAEARKVEAGAERIDLVVTDVAMPGELGPELAAYLRKHRPGLRTLLISRYDPQELRKHEVDLQGSPFLRKPFMPEQLLSAVENALRQ